MASIGDTALAAGFDLLLRIHGRTLKLLRTGTEFTCLVEKVEPDQSEHTLAKETNVANDIAIARPAYVASGVSVKVGDHFKDETENYVHRVTEKRIHPNTPSVVFRCETAPIL